MEELNILRQKVIIYLQFLSRVSKSRGGMAQVYLHTIKKIELANKRGLLAASRDVDEHIRLMSRSESKELRQELEKKLGISYDHLDDQFLLKIETIKARGKIRSKEEYRAVKERINLIFQTDSAAAEVEELNLLLQDFDKRMEKQVEQKAKSTSTPPASEYPQSRPMKDLSFDDYVRPFALLLGLTLTLWLLSFIMPLPLGLGLSEGNEMQEKYEEGIINPFIEQGVIILLITYWSIFLLFLYKLKKKTANRQLQFIWTVLAVVIVNIFTTSLIFHYMQHYNGHLRYEWNEPEYYRDNDFDSIPF